VRRPAFGLGDFEAGTAGNEHRCDRSRYGHRANS
jgi:hypothetical protein